MHRLKPRPISFHFAKKAYHGLLIPVFRKESAMLSFVHSQNVQFLAGIAIGSVWVFHGLYSKLLNGIPRHRLIVGRVLGNKIAGTATKLIGVFEVLLGFWVFSGWERPSCAVVQTLALVGMNTLEIFLAGDLLISAIGMVALNLGFLSLIWFWALSAPKP